MNDHRTPGVPTGAFPDIVPVLTRGAVRLRPMAEADLPALVEQSNDAECVRWTTVAQPYGPDQAREFLQRQAHEWGEPAGRRSWAVGGGFRPPPGGPWALDDVHRAADGGRLGLRPRGAEPVLVLRRVGAVDAWVASLLPGHPMTPQHVWVHPEHHLPAREIPSPQTFDDWLLRRREGMSLGRGVNWCIADAASARRSTGSASPDQAPTTSVRPSQVAICPSSSASSRRSSAPPRPGSQPTRCARSAPAARSALRSTRPTRSSPRRKGST